MPSPDCWKNGLISLKSLNVLAAPVARRTVAMCYSQLKVSIADRIALTSPLWMLGIHREEAAGQGKESSVVSAVCVTIYFKGERLR